MYRVITGLPDGVIGVEAKGEISASDYTDVLDPLVAQRPQRTDHGIMFHRRGDNPVARTQKTELMRVLHI